MSEDHVPDRTPMSWGEIAYCTVCHVLWPCPEATE